MKKKKGQNTTSGSMQMQTYAPLGRATRHPQVTTSTRNEEHQ